MMEIRKIEWVITMTCEERVKSEEYREVLRDYKYTEAETSEGVYDYCRVEVDSDIYIIYFKPGLGTPSDINLFPYYEIPKCYGLMQQEETDGSQIFDSLALAEAGILQIQKEPLALTGQGVIVGVIDTGIRYTQEVFRDGSGGSRILAIWDQTLNEGIAPEGFLYGTEYVKAQIDDALQSESPREVVPSWDTNGHGTAIASVAAGSLLDGGRRFTGAAPDADIVVVKLREAKQYLKEYYILPEGAVAYSETDILMAVKYLEAFAVERQRPVVICLGIGTSYGSHTGSSALDRYLNIVAQRRSRAIIVCGGNEGAADHHIQGQASSAPQSLEMRVGENENGFLMEVWAEGPSRYQMTLRTPGGETVSRITGSGRRTETYSFVFDRTVITVDSFLLEESTGRSLIIFRFVEPTQGVWTFTIRADVAIAGGTFNIWLPIEEFLQNDTHFLRSDPEITLTAPSMAQGVITITAYNDKDGGFYEKSGRGFTADRRVKPEFAAPGVNISTSLGKRTGSSLAAAIAAGASAQMMQWAVVNGNYPLASGRELKYYLALGAVRESGIEYPSREWGLGKINVQHTFQELAGLF